MSIAPHSSLNQDPYFKISQTYGPEDLCLKNNYSRLVESIVSSSKGIRSTLQTVGYLLASHLFYPLREFSKLLRARAVHSAYKITKIWAQKVFEPEDFIRDARGVPVSSRNIASKDVLASKADQAEAEKLLGLCCGRKVPLI